MGLKKDKAKHMLGSFAGVITLRALGLGTGLAALLIFTLGLAKELWDYVGHGVASWEDMAANLIGIAFAMLLIWWLEQRKKEKELKE